MQGFADNFIPVIPIEYDPLHTGEHPFCFADPSCSCHLFVVPEEDLPPKLDYLGTAIAVICSLVLIGIVGLFLFSPKGEPTVSFTAMIPGFQLAPVSRSTTITIDATGKGHVAASYATSTITFYNGQTYTQIIPVGTILKGADGVTAITDTRAVIPPAAQTTPPTYGQVSVPAHALQAGAIGNIQAGDINEPCCVTSVIAQNPYNFTGGTDARDFTYLTAQDVSYAVADNMQRLEDQTRALFTARTVLEPTCTTTHRVSLATGSQTRTAQLSLTALCTAVSYSLALARNRIMEAGKRYGELSTIQFAIVGITQKKGRVVLHLFVTAQVRWVVHVPIR